MLKHKFKFITLLVVIILSLMVPIVRAENEIVDNSSTTISEDSSENVESITTTSTDDTFKKGDVYLCGDDVTVDYIVDGNLFIFANKVTIDSQVGGDAFICAGSVEVTEKGYVFSNLFAFAQNVTVSGVVYDLYAAAENVTINGYVYRDIRVGSNNLNINGIIGRNAFVDSNNIQFAETSGDENQVVTSKGIINGDFNYSSIKEASIPEGSVSGNQNFTPAKEDNSKSTSIQDYVLSLGVSLATAVIIWLICLWLAPKFLNNTNTLISKKLLPVIGFGILTPIVAVVLFIPLLILGITTNIALLELGLFFLFIAISFSIFAIAINNLICSKLKIEKNIGKFGLLLATTFVLWLLEQIPYVGAIVSFVSCIIGLGIIIRSIIPVKEKTKKTEKDKKVKKSEIKD